MACKYFVNGDWVTEDQLKEILNNGLLDNLISSNKIQVAGFKTDPAKLLKTTKQVVERTTVPARKLADILANEVKTREGYPPNMLSALELNIVKNDDGTINEELTDFKIPLWASPHAKKFESLLTSIISKKVVKTKAPGNSYVLGSQEGFKIKEGDKAAGELKKSGIVFSDSFDAEKGLLPMRYDEATGTILPDQVMIPFKFRDEQGKILKLEDFTVKGPDGRIMMDTDKIPAKLLKLFGYRIPTGGRNQMASIEIVGFLPETSGDLILAPRDFTKRMGSDFDVDKLYTYNYNHFYDSESGQIKTNFLSDKKTIEKNIEAQKEKINTIKESMKVSKKDQKLLDAYVEDRLKKFETETETEEDLILRVNEIIEGSMSMDLEAAAKKLDHAFDILSVLKRSYKASRENNIQDIRLQILESTTPEILASNLGLDSYGEFESLAPEVDRIRRSRGLVPGITTILSDIYQRNKYVNATAGKDGVGSFSLDSTFNVAAQGKDLTILNLTEEAQEALMGSFEEPRYPSAAEILEANTPVSIFGDAISKGDLSNKYTLRSQALIKAANEQNRPLTEDEKDSLKLKSTIIKNLQSTAVDNEKFQILDKLNINTNTFDAIRAMTMLGFEEKDIAGLLTQEIIWEFINKLVTAQSSLVAYNPNAEADIFEELLKKYDPEGKFLSLPEEEQQEWMSASGEELIADLETETLKPLKEGDITLDFNMKQIGALSKFIRLTEVGKQIKQLQSSVNTASKGLPKSILEVQAKAKQINELEKSAIFNSGNLLGEYNKNGFLEKPTTINGFASYYGTLFADTLYNKFFPYNTEGFAAITSEVFMHMPNALDKSLNKQTEMRRDIFEDMRSFLYANTNSNLFGEDPDAERRRLFIDVIEGPNKNMSLAKILSTISTQSWYQKNGFLNKLDMSLNTNGTISRINFEAAAAENFDERNIYDGFLYLLDKNFVIKNPLTPDGTFNNGVTYTSRMLAQELVAAAFLEGGNQGSKQYLKYVPTSYLKTMGFGNYLGNIIFDFQSEFYGNVNDNGIIYTAPSRFARQYFQNNPDKVKTVSLSNLEGQNTVIPDQFTLNESALAANFIEVPDPFTGEPIMEQTKFLSIYDSKLPGKYALYEFDSGDRIYRRVPVLVGSYGFVQYNSDSSMPTPIEAANRIPTRPPNITAPGFTVNGNPVTPTKGFDVNVVNNPKPTAMAKDLVLAKELNKTKGALDDIINVLQDAEGISSLNHLLLDQLRELNLPEDFTVEYTRDNYQESGSYNYASHTLKINLNSLPYITADRLASVVAHELIHAHTGEAIYNYLDGKLDTLNEKQISAIKKLEELQKQYVKHLEDSDSKEELDKFIESYNNFKTGKAKTVQGNISKLYGAMKLTEFVTMALTDQGFQNHLKNIIDKNGLSIWDKIKQVLSELLQALGMDIPAGSALATTIKETMDLISATQEAMPAGQQIESFKYYGAYYDIKVVNGAPVDVVNLKKNAAETNVRFEERKNKILNAFKQDPNIDPQTKRNPITPTVQSEQRQYTPENITTLKPNQVFVFGANTAGGHGGGTAGLAQRGTTSSNYTALPIGTKGKWAEYGIVDKLMQGTEGKSFGIVTKAANISGTALQIGAKRSVPLSRIEQSINALIAEAKAHPELEFLVTKFGTNMAGFTIEEIKSLLVNKTLPDNIILPKEFEVRDSQPAAPVATVSTTQTNVPKQDTVINIYAGTGENAELSNFAVRPFEIDGYRFSTVEGYFHARKLDFSSEPFDAALLQKFQTAPGNVARTLGKAVKGLKVEEWDKASSAIMKEGLLESFKQNPNALAKLLATGNATLTHKFNGAEQDKGRFSKLLMEVRSELKAMRPTAFVKPTIDLSREWKDDLESRPVYTQEGINTMRTTSAKPNEHFGNPFSEAGYGDTIKTSSIAQAVMFYKEWLLGEEFDSVKPEQRKWILDQINQGKLDGATLLYAGKSAARGQGMHPTALAEVVELMRFNPEISKTEDVKETPRKDQMSPEQAALKQMLFENGFDIIQGDDGTYDVLDRDGVVADYVPTIEEALQLAQDLLAKTQKIQTPPPPVAPAAPISNNLNINGVTINTGEITVNQQQLDALQNVANFVDSIIKGNVSDVDISYTLAGYAGTGKTTITKFVLQYLSKKRKNYVICSPTHRAKEVLSDATGEKARTLAQVLGLAAGVDLEDFNLQDKIFVAKNKDKVPSAGILVIDEASMINDALYKEVIQLASKKGTKVLFIGDDGQLKPVKQIQKSQAFRRTTNISKLTQVMRTADGNPMPAEVLQPIRDNPLSRVDMFDHATKLSDKGEGIEFTNSQDNWTKEMLAEFTMEKFDKNPNHARALAYTNARVRDLNQMIRTNMFGFGAEPFYNGELLMMYENLFYNMGTQDYDFSNGADVKVVGVEYQDQHVIKSPSGASFTVRGYRIRLVDAKTGKPKESDLFIADMNLVDKDYLHELARLKTAAISAPSNNRAEAWKNYYQFSSKYNLTDDVYEINGFILPADEALKVLKDKNPNATKKNLGPYKAKDKSVDYAYAHTIHKSQGGTYAYAFVDENNIDIARNFPSPDFELINQLKYVGFSRSSKKTVVLSGKTGAAAGPVQPKSTGLDMSKLSDPNKYKTPGTDFTGEDYTGPVPGADYSLETSVINRDDYENYLLICGK